jgi:hypothetical protein
MFWLQYHSREDIIGPRLWLTPLHSAVRYLQSLRQPSLSSSLLEVPQFIHGPFDFAVIHGQKSCNHIPQSPWDKLKSHSDMFHNQIPRFDIPTYSIHVDRGAHISCFCAIQANELIQLAKRAVQSPG